MNEDNGFNNGYNTNFNLDNNNFNVGETNTNTTPNEQVVYDSYYNHKSHKSPWPTIILILLAIGMIIVAILWMSGVFTPVDHQAEYDKVFSRVCTAAVSYANTNDASAKKESGKIVYVTVAQLANANLIEANLINYLTNEPIDPSTNIRLEVLPSGSFQCHGFLFPGDDTVKPVVTLKGSSTIEIPVGTTATDPGATAVDDKDGDISNRIERSGNVNTGVAGTYKIDYVVSDVSGNASDVVTRTYIVK